MNAEKIGISKKRIIQQKPLGTKVRLLFYNVIFGKKLYYTKNISESLQELFAKLAYFDYDSGSMFNIFPLTFVKKIILIHTWLSILCKPWIWFPIYQCRQTQERPILIYHCHT